MTIAPNKMQGLATRTVDVSQYQSERQAAELKRANTNFEAVMLRQLVTALRKMVPTSESTPASSRMYEHFIEDGLSQHLADSGGIGLGELLEMKKDLNKSTMYGEGQKKGTPPVKLLSSIVVDPAKGTM